MDIYDQAAEIAATYSSSPAAEPSRRNLEPAEFLRLVDHLLDTEMPIPDALRALRIDATSLTIDDLDRVSAVIARCSECRTWTRKTSLIGARCPACVEELETSEEDTHAR